MRRNSRRLGKSLTTFQKSICMVLVLISSHYNRVRVKIDTYPGLPHGFMMFPQLQSSQKCSKELIEGVRWLTS